MEPGLRARFNADFTPEKYSALLRCVNEATKWPADFRISETPIFLTREFTDEAIYAANEIAVGAGQVDMATDFDRNRNAMIASGRVKADSNKIVWQSVPLPNDAIVLPSGASKELAAQVQKVLTSISADEAKTLLPPRYTGFVAATHASYAQIEKAGIAVGKIKPRT